MTQDKIEMLSKNGIDAMRLIKLVGNNDALFLRLINKFFASTDIEELEKAIEATDSTAGFQAAHSLKGMAGNVGLTRLYEILCGMVSAYRMNNLGKVFDFYSEFTTEIETAKNAISQI